MQIQAKVKAERFRQRVYASKPDIRLVKAGQAKPTVEAKAVKTIAPSKHPTVAPITKPPIPKLRYLIWDIGPTLSFYTPLIGCLRHEARLLDRIPTLPASFQGSMALFETLFQIDHVEADIPSNASRKVLTFGPSTNRLR